jgi:uncharacterized Fe-S cluster protein YjdI
MKDITKKYSNGEVTIVWKPNLCIHSTNCFKGLGRVFDPSRRPWVTPEGATTDEIIDQVRKCPSGALSYYPNSAVSSELKEADAETMVEAKPDGPLMVYGMVNVKLPDGSVVKKHSATAFCRCGGSGNKPFCDGTHRKIGFSG